MSALPDTPDIMHDLTAWLAAAPRGSLDPVLVEERVRAVLRLLEREERRWIGAAEAQRLLGLV